MGGLIIHDGVLYGTTSNGGAYGGGTVFDLTLSGSLTTLYNFGGAGADGAEGDGPTGDLLFDNGLLYGTAFFGGNSNGDGTVFALALPSVPEPAWGPVVPWLLVLLIAWRWYQRGGLSRLGRKK